MSDTATTPPPPLRPDNDPDGGTAKVRVVAGPANPPPARQPPAPGGARPEGGPNADAPWLEAARREAARLEFEACLHAEAQFEACAEWERRSMRMGILTAVLGALTASTIASVLGDAGVISPVQAAGGGVAHHLRDWTATAKLPLAVGALVAGVIAAAVRFLDPQGRATLHGAAGKRYRALQDEARQFRELGVTADATRDSLRGQLQTLAKRRAEIHEAAPVIPKRAFNATREKAATDRGMKEIKDKAEAGQPPV